MEVVMGIGMGLLAFFVASVVVLSLAAWVDGEVGRGDKHAPSDKGGE